MKHMRRWTGLLLAMMLLFLSGCGDAAESSSPESQDGEAGASALLQFELPQEGDEIVVIHTSMGTLKVMLFPEVAPKAVENFVTHAKEGYYNGLKFYKVQKNKCLYTGDPNGDGTGGESVFQDENGRVQPFEDEYSMDLWHFNGALSMVNDGAEDHNGSRFCFVQSSSVNADMLLEMKNIGFPSNVILKYAGVGGAPWLDTKQVVFAQVYDGLDVLDAIAAVEVDENGVPKENVVINSMSVEKYQG